MLGQNRHERRREVLEGREERRLFPRSGRRRATAFAKHRFFFGAMLLHDLHSVPPGDRKKWRNQRKGERRALRRGEPEPVEVRRASRRSKLLTKRQRKAARKLR